jgi:peptide/nickel transport system substrate-binding protein
MSRASREHADHPWTSGLRFSMAVLANRLAVRCLAGELVSPTTPPDPPAMRTGPAAATINPADIAEFGTVPHYREPDSVTRKFVANGLLPPLARRLPEQPLIFKAGDMPDGIGVYGDALRHVTGGRPEGWNFMAGQSQDGGGVDIGTMECLTSTGSLYRVRAADLEPMPNLAKSWEWSADGHKLTMLFSISSKGQSGPTVCRSRPTMRWELCSPFCAHGFRRL